MDAAYELPVWSESFSNVGLTTLENLRAVTAQEDQHVNARLLYNATAAQTSDKMGEVIATLAKEVEKQKGRGRGRGRGRGGVDTAPQRGRGNGEGHATK